MGQKVNPKSLRLPLSKDWQSKWFAGVNYAKNIREDLEIRNMIAKKLGKAFGIGKMEIIRDHEKITVNIYSSKPGMIIGRSGQGRTDLVNYLLSQVPSFRTLNQKQRPKLRIEVIEIRGANTNGQLIAENIAVQIEKRIAYKRAIKQAIAKAMEGRALGIKIQISGRLNGAEIARSEKYGQNSVPLGRLKADIDYGYAVALTTYGTIGIKVWVYRKEKTAEEV